MGEGLGCRRRHRTERPCRAGSAR